MSLSAAVSTYDTHCQVKHNTRKMPLKSHDLFDSDSDLEEEEEVGETNSPGEAKRAQLTQGKSKCSVARRSRANSRRDYGFEPRDPAEETRRAMSQTMGSFIPGPEAKTPDVSWLFVTHSASDSSLLRSSPLETIESGSKAKPVGVQYPA